MNDLGAAFSFPFKDRNWVVKFLLGAVFMILSLLLVGIFILAGYFVELTQRVMRRDENPLPEWDDIGGKFVRGFKFCLVYLIYLLPIIVIYVPIVIFTVILPILEGDYYGDMGGDAPAILLGSYLFLSIFLIVLPYSLALTLLFPLIAFRFALRESIGDALDVAEIFRLFRRNWQNTLIVALIGVGVQSLAGFGIVIFLVGIFFTIMYAYLISFHLYGSLYLEAMSTGEVS